jgi:glucan phosphoethanolaminetransferase (alkaline phosphatase superfamily)
MITILAIILIFVFLIISIIHFYWVFGGLKGLNKALPTNEKGKRVLNPGKIETFIVGLGLLFFAIYYSTKIEILEIELPKFVMDYSGWIISSIFILRAIGEFKYVGFFKKIKNTEFGKFDTKYFSILSLIIGIIGIIIEMM